MRFSYQMRDLTVQKDTVAEKAGIKLRNVGVTDVYHMIISMSTNSILFKSQQTCI